MRQDPLHDPHPRSTSPKEWEARLLLHLTPGIGPTRFHALISRFGSGQAVLGAPGPALADILKSRAPAEALGDLAGHRLRLGAARSAASNLDFGVLLWEDKGYPACLRRLHPCPPALWVMGKLPPLPGLAIVGTRTATGSACAKAAGLAQAATGEGLTVVSGGAYGVDAAAHRGALAAGGLTVVVLGGGLDRPYPERHIALFKAAATQGAVVSTFPPGTPPARGGFLARNAVIAALSEAVTVVEAGFRSGAHSTAHAARKLGLPVLAVPGSPGTDRLLAEGARPMKEAGRLRAVLRGDPEMDAEAEFEPLPEEQALALRALEELGSSVAEEVAERSGLEPLEALAALMALVVEGRAMQEPGGRYRPLTGAPAFGTQT